MKTYKDLMRAFPLEPIRDDAHLDAAMEVIDQLVDHMSVLTPAEDLYLNTLSDLVYAYEEVHVFIPEVVNGDDAG